MSAFTPEQHTQYKEFVDLNAKSVSEFILKSGHDFSSESIIKLGNLEAKSKIMDFPDYDEDQPFELEDSLVVLYFDYVDDEIEFSMLYDFFCKNLNYCLCKITGAEN